jgi:hypothetical protein
MKKFFGAAAIVVALGLVSVTAHATPVVVAISGPTNGSTITVDELPATIQVTGSVSHPQAAVNDMRACVEVDGGSPVCGDYIAGAGNLRSFGFNLPVDLYEGTHTLRVYADKSSGGHYGFAEITVTVVLSTVACDELDPPAIANAYLNSLDLPNSYNQIRGSIISTIAHNMNAGRYGTCTYNAALVRTDVDSLLAKSTP